MQDTPALINALLHPDFVPVKRRATTPDDVRAKRKRVAKRRAKKRNAKRSQKLNRGKS
jgi:hypothetical protein